MPTLRIAGTILAAAVGLWAADDPFATAQKPLREKLKSPAIDPSAIAPFEELVKLAGGDDQRIEAIGMLAEALRRAELHERAAAQWGAIADLERKRQLADRTARVWQGEMNRLRSLERIKPLPGAQIAACAKQTLLAGDPAFSIEQRMALVGYAVKGIQAEKTQAAAAAWVTEQVQLATADGAYRNELHIQLLSLQDGQPMTVPLAICDRIAGDPQALPQQVFHAIGRKAYILGVNRRSAAAFDEVRRLEAVFSAAIATGWKPNLTAFLSLRWAAALARRQEDFALAERLLELMRSTTTEQGWTEISRLELALVRRMERRWPEARELYTALSASTDARMAGEAQLHLAFLIYRDIGDAATGLPLIEAALRNEKTLFALRSDAVMTEARRLLALGDRAAATAWLSRIETIPGNAKDTQRALSVALTEMGVIAESTGDKAAAARCYQRSLDQADGDLDARLRARDALRDLRYFE